MDAHGIAVKEKASASQKLGKSDARALLRAASKLYVAKGKKLDEFSVASSISAAAVDAMLGPTGNLRAPCLKLGKSIVVGFNEDLYRERLL
jgi:arsenate reductase-like glutaredoxin family protein